MRNSIIVQILFRMIIPFWELVLIIIYTKLAFMPNRKYIIILNSNIYKNIYLLFII